MDITDMILRQHDEQRRGFALLDDMGQDDDQTLAAVWSRLAILLEVHAEAEEKFFYPALLKLGKGPSGVEGPAGEVQDAVKDHNQIRDAVREVGSHPTGSSAWWAAVRDVRKANSDHMAEEERDDLADFRRHSSLQSRHDIAVAFVAFESAHSAGIAVRDKDPQDYVARSGREVD